MGIVPRKLHEKVSFFKTRLAKLAENATALGLTEADVAELQTAVLEAEAALREQQMAQLAAQSATLQAKIALEQMSLKGSAIISRVRIKAESRQDPSLYPLASLPMPAGRTSMPAPGMPTRFTAEIDGVGNVTLSWTCDNPRGSIGTTYQVRRQVGDGPMEFIGLSGDKRFVDKTIPAAATRLTYEVRAIRSTKLGEANTFNVNFGSNGVVQPAGMFQSRPKKMTLAA